MSENEESQFCPNCLKSVSGRNFTIHIVHCQRNIVLCPKCKEPFSKPQLEEHLENAHKTIRCKLCHEEVENCRLEEHEKNCTKRTVQCTFCELDYALDDLNAHEDYCGSRTEKCEDCGQYVMLKDQINHLANGHLIPEREKLGLNNNFPSLRNNFGEENVPLTNENYYTRQNPTKRTNDMPQLNTSINDYQKDSEKIKISDLDVDSSQNLMAPSDYDALLALQLAEDEADAVNPFLPIANPPFVNDLLEPLRQSPLGFGLVRGSKLSPSLISTDHPFHSNNVWSHSELDRMFSSEQIFNKGKENIATDESNEYLGPELNESLPCEFCGELFPADMLIIHESGCCPDIAHGLTHESNKEVTPTEQRSQPAPEILSTQQLKYPAYENENSDENLMIACVFCNYLYPAEILHEHEDVCSVNPLVAEAELLEALCGTSAQIKEGSPTRKLGSSYSSPLNEVVKESTIPNAKIDHNLHKRDNEERKRSLPEERQPPADRRFSDLCVENSTSVKRTASNQKLGDIKTLNAVKTKPTPTKNTYPRELRQGLGLRDDLVVTGTRPKFVNSVNNQPSPQIDVPQRFHHNQRQQQNATAGSKDENVPAHCRSANGELQDAYSRLLAMRRTQHGVNPLSPQGVSQSRSQESQINNLRPRAPIGKTGAVPKQKRQT